MILLEDTRNQIGKHENIRNYCLANGIEIVRTKLLVGDYTLPTNQKICVDTKFGIEESYSNLTEYTRFHNEYCLAERAGINLIVLIEDLNIRSIDDVEHWENPLFRKYEKGLINSKPRGSKAIATQMRTIQENHGLRWEFCHPRDTGRVLIELLGGER